MAKCMFLSPAGLLVAGLTMAGMSTGTGAFGIIGYGLEKYNPPCAYACREAVSFWTLQCDDGSGYVMDHGGTNTTTTTTPPSPLCFATNDAFLQTLAWCLYTHCPHDVRNATREDWWEAMAAGWDQNQPLPKESYQEAVAKAATDPAPPTTTTSPDAVLNQTSLVDEDTYRNYLIGFTLFKSMEVRHEQYGLVLVITCAVLPIALSLAVRFLPLPPAFLAKLYAYLIDPPLFGRHHARPAPLFAGLGQVPTRGQALFLAYVLVANVVLCSAGYRVDPSSAFYADLPYEQLATYLADRAAVLCLVNLVLAVLLASRNSPLLPLTGWSPATLVLLHRWVAVVATAQAALHTALYVYMTARRGADYYAGESASAYWRWGAAAVALMCLAPPLSVAPLRTRLYEPWLACHVAMAAMVLAGAFMHIYSLYALLWGYQTWVIVAVAAWGLDRFVARPLRLVLVGGGGDGRVVRKAHVTLLDDDYFRVHVPGLEAEGYVFLYFPTLTWRVWENHPFSVAAVSSVGAVSSPPLPIGGQKPGGSSPAREEGSIATDEEKQPQPREQPSSAQLSSTPTTATTTTASTTSTTSTTNYSTSPAAAVFFARRRAGITAKLAARARAHHTASATIPVLIEGSYGAPHHSSSHPATLAFPHVLFLAGGVGITAVLPLVFLCASRPSTLSAKLFWSSRSPALVRAVEALMVETDGGGGIVEDRKEEDEKRRNEGTATMMRRRWARGGVDVTISVGARFELRTLLRDEVARGPTTVVVSGPPAMADEARCVVAGLGRNGAVVRFREEAFAW